MTRVLPAPKSEVFAYLAGVGNLPPRPRRRDERFHVHDLPAWSADELLEAQHASLFRELENIEREFAR